MTGDHVMLDAEGARESGVADAALPASDADDSKGGTDVNVRRRCATRWIHHADDSVHSVTEHASIITCLSCFI